MKKLLIVFFIVATGYSNHLFSQAGLGNFTGDESEFYAQTKQVNQFFRRFNNEEDRLGNRYYPKDSLYRDNAFRKVYLKMLFNQQNSSIDETLKKEFIETATDPNHPVYLDFHGGNWFAEVASTFDYKGYNENLILFLRLEAENLGYKWVLTNVYYVRFLKQFFKGEKRKIDKEFLHPMSHELDFMNLHKAFEELAYTEYYAYNNYKPDFLSLLFYELKIGDMKFIRSGEVKFHFFQVDGWYFEVSFFNRPGYNSGWLISNLFKVTEQEKQDLIKFYQP
ncbi:MAG: hypothetical protein JW731_14220 [Bacteroidales bacterium]|nr:hypothetical protein [Bacteroidales bacterium]